MRKRLQMEKAAEGIRQLARDLQALQPLGQGRDNRKAVPRAARQRDCRNRPTYPAAGLHVRACASGRLRGFKKTGGQSIGRSKGGLTCKIHMTAFGARTAAEFILSGGQCHDAPQGRLLMETVGPLEVVTPLVMDRAYEDDQTRRTAQGLTFSPVVPPLFPRNPTV